MENFIIDLYVFLHSDAPNVQDQFPDHKIIVYLKF